MGRGPGDGESMSRFTRWLFEVTDNSNLAFVVVATVLIGFGYLMGGMANG